MNICEEIRCPFYCDASNGYGCRRYNVSNHCHLLTKFYGLQPNQYILSGGKTNSELAMIKLTNDDYFTEDEYYKETLEFQKTHSDWLSKTEFRVREIAK